MKIYLSILILILSASSCQKKDIDVPLEELEGDYEWFYSDNGVAFDVSQDKYGIRITGNGRIKIFKNGDLIEKYKIIETSELFSEQGTKIEARDEEKPIFFTLTNDTLKTSTYPQEGSFNYYLKSK